MIEWFRIVTRLKILGETTWLLTKSGHYIKNLHFWYNLLTFSDNCGATPTSAPNGCSTTVIRIEKKTIKKQTFFKSYWKIHATRIWEAFTLREKCPNTEFFVLRIFPHSVQIRENTKQKKLRIWTLFMQWYATIYGGKCS